MSQKSGTNVDFPHCFAPPAPPGVVFRVRNAERERVTWKRRAPIGCRLIAIPSCLASRPSRAILSVTWHLRARRRNQLVASVSPAQEMCTRCVASAALCDTSFAASAQTSGGVGSAGRRVCFPRRDPTTVFLETTAVKCRHCDSRVLFDSEICCPSVAAT